MITAELLRRLRNDLPMQVTIAALGREGPPAKMSEGYFRFLCPGCGEMLATVNPRNNLAHCFCCQKNINNIDLLISMDYEFTAAVQLLQTEQKIQGFTRAQGIRIHRAQRLERG